MSACVDLTFCLSKRQLLYFHSLLNITPLLYFFFVVTVKFNSIKKFCK